MIQLRPYQLDAIARTRLAVSQGGRAVLVVSPTGSGKTTIASEIVRSAVALGGRVLWLCHRDELIEQGRARLRQFGLTVGTIAAGSDEEPNPNAPIQIASIQTLIARPDARPAATLVIWDECHHSVSDQWSTLAAYYGSAHLIGFTATPERCDGKGLGAVFDRLVVVTRVKELVEQGFLVPTEIIRPGSKLRSGRIAQSPAVAYQKHASGRPTIVFSPSVMAAEQHREEFRLAGVEARVVSGKMPRAERSLFIDAFRRGTIKVLVNVYVLSEGFDAPETSCVILARGFGTAGTYIQTVGRGLRPAEGKTDCLLIDLHGTSWDHGHPEDDRIYSLEGRGIRRADDNGLDIGSSCRVCGAPIESGEACNECGTEPKVLAAPKVTNAPLVKYTGKRAEGIDQRAETLARWIAVGRSKNYKTKWAHGRFRHVYGHWPDHTIEARALEILDVQRGAA